MACVCVCGGGGGVVCMSVWSIMADMLEGKGLIMHTI